MTDTADDEAGPGSETQAADANGNPPEADRGLIAQVTWLCPGCGLDASVAAWVVLDLRQRPDLWPTARAAVVCPECAVEPPQQPLLMVMGTPSHIPLLVTREGPPDEPKIVRLCRVDHPLPDTLAAELLPHSPMILLAPTDAEPLLHAGQLLPRHARVVEEARAIGRLQDALVAALAATTAAELEATVEAHPDLFGRAVLAEWQEHGAAETSADQARTPAQTALDEAPDTLLDYISRMPAAQAWQRYLDRFEQAHRAFGVELQGEFVDLVAASERGEASRAMADRCVYVAELVPANLAGQMWSIRALMLISPSLSTPGDIEDAIGALAHAIDLYEEAHEPVAAAEARSNLVVALQMRPRQREVSLERAIVLLEELVVFWEGLPDLDRAALVRTNLAVALLDRKAGAPVDNARRALEQCTTALLHRSLERNPVDYVYTLAAKALAHSRLTESDEEHLLAAEQAYEEALDVLPPDAEPHLLARIFFNYCDLLVTAARQRPHERTDFLARAEACARRAAQVHEEHGHTQELAFAQRQLARMLAQEEGDDSSRSRLDEARGLLFQSLQVLTPADYPADCIPTADDAVAVCQRLDDWQGASLASLTALAAWSASGGDTVSREDVPPPPEERDPVLAELAHDSRFRFTAYTMFRAAQQHIAQGAALAGPEAQTLLEQAVGVMEAGRAVTLRAASGAEVRELQRLRAIDPALAEAYLSAVDKARSEAHTHARPPGPGRDASRTAELPLSAPATAGLSLEQLLATIRNLPGFSDFARGQPPSVAELKAVLKPGQALVYLIAHPVGCCALVVTPNTPVVPVDLPATNSARLFTLIFGIGRRTDGSPDGLTPGKPRPGEALLAGTFFHAHRYRGVLRTVLAELGRTFVRRLAHALTDTGITDAVLVPCGLLPSFAWHAASWRERGRTTSLTDVLDTCSYAPSASAWLAARKRVQRLAERPPFLVGLANPSRSHPSLPAAEAELRHVVTRFPPQRSAVAYGADATGRFLLGRLPEATHLHLGCHGTMRYDSVDGASLTLADAEQLDIARIRRLAGDGLRLVVVAACVSGAVNVILQPEESHALTISFMHAGAAGVLGALWPIPDYPTALFITRFYEELTTPPGVEPAVALARTQWWMRSLTSTAARRYAAERPALAAFRGRSGLRGSVPQTAAGYRRAGLPALRKRPFDAPEIWAAFVLNGC
ncbi:CHAT domain-containing protein [Streptomyces sp. NBC_00452]|uniref:CHAT domain-containing protein n=1 Tax=Streptomyces sp. NBC_00452 TaxID=2975746 RepID=UPI00224F4E55|nr:CHAT domain-containing protein [Streptomyces sp. NBC_00452]MCX5063819.1 CHAT domain-containing protein [Streptomyces sp. NBC_00452]